MSETKQSLRMRLLRWCSLKYKEELSYNHCKKYGCDSCCPRCKIWESEGNTIYTIANEGDTDTRTCTNCGYEWLTIFTPAGHYPINDKDIIKEE